MPLLKVRQLLTAGAFSSQLQHKVDSEVGQNQHLQYKKALLLKFSETFSHSIFSKVFQQITIQNVFLYIKKVLSYKGILRGAIGK